MNVFISRHGVAFKELVPGVTKQKRLEGWHEHSSAQGIVLLRIYPSYINRRNWYKS